jgi:hypothetical protein
MAYKINNTFGTTLVTLEDGTIDTTTTDLALFGKGYAGFGERLNENLVKLLENFSNTSAPTKKIKGQLWYDSLNNQIKVWNGNKFKPVGSSTNSTSAPTNANTGDFWFDTTNSQFYVYGGNSWTLIGPTTVAGSGVTQASPATVEDNVGVNKSILKLVTNDIIVAIVSAEEFTPGTAISGFATIYKGITLSTSVGTNRFAGTATNADALGGVSSANFLTSNANDTTSGSLGIINDAGLTVGAGSDLTITVSGTDVTIANTSSNGDIIFTVNDGGVVKEVLRMDGADGRISHLRVGDLTVDGTQTIINTTTLSIEDNIIELNRNISSAAGMPSYSGLKVNRGETSTTTEQNLYWVWDETFADDGTTIYGNAGGAWTAFKASSTDSELEAPTLVDIRANIVHATSTAAQYADLAERYAADMQLSVGEVVILGGKQEITLCTEELDNAVFGVVSENPAFLMNSEAGNNDSHPMIALKGRVLVKIKGTGTAGDRIVSAGNGEARVAKLEECTAFNTLGRLLKDKYLEQTQLHECVIGVK